MARSLFPPHRSITHIAYTCLYMCSTCSCTSQNFVFFSYMEQFLVCNLCLMNRAIIKYLDPEGESYKTIKLGVDLIRGVCPMNVSSTSLLVVTKQHKVELRRTTSGRLIHRIQSEHFDPCAICPSGSDTVLVASWSLNTQSSLIELQVSLL